MEKLDWMKTMSHRWMDGCLSADGQKTRVYENPCPTGGWMDASLQMDRKLDCMKIHVPEVCIYHRTSGRKAFWRFGRKTRLDENHVPQVDGWMPLCRWTEN